MSRQAVVNQAKAWLGLKESNGSHKQIIDVYNSHKPLARGYAVKYTDPWCATFVSAVAIKLGLTNIIPPECGCQKMIELFKKLGAWQENDAYIPNPGDVIFYDWDDSGSGDNIGHSDHVGYVENVADGKIVVIEGNYSNSVKRRTLSVNGKYIRGYGVPKYDANAADEPVIQDPVADKMCDVAVKQLSEGCIGRPVMALQALLVGYGGNNAKIIKNAGGVDGEFGPGTYQAVCSFQRENGLVGDGVVGPLTWAKLLGM